MLPVVSARKKMSGFGGIGDVSTDFEIVVDAPGSSVSVTVLGVTPGAATAAPPRAIAIVETPAVASRLRFRARSLSAQ
jgi:hypothetical protein